PPHVRRRRGAEPGDVPREEADALTRPFLADVEEKLHAEANAEAGQAVLERRCERGTRARHRPRRRAECSDARQDQQVGADGAARATQSLARTRTKFAADSNASMPRVSSWARRRDRLMTTSSIRSPTHARSLSRVAMAARSLIELTLYGPRAFNTSAISSGAP